MSTLTDLNFINAIIRWLSEFHNSPITSTSNPIDLSDPHIIYRTLVILLNDEDLQVQKDYPEFFTLQANRRTEDDQIHFSLDINKQIQIIEVVLQNHFNNNKCKMKKIEGLRLICSKVNFCKMILFQDINAIAKFCELVLKIGIYSSKLSTFGLTSVGFLSDLDKESIDEYFGKDFREIDIEDYNLVLIEKLQNEYLEEIEKIESEKNLQLSNESRKHTEKKNEYVKIIDNLKLTLRSYEEKYNTLLRRSNDTTGDNEQLHSLTWENDLYQQLIYSLLSK